MKNYDEMSDFEINQLVAIGLGIDVPKEMNPWIWKTEFCLHQMNGDGSKVEKTIVANYCNNPSDAWQIIVENKINIEWRDSLKLQPLAKGTGGKEFWHADKNPLRAAMICFLKMKDSEQ